MPLISLAYIGLLLLVAATPVLLFFDNLVFAGAIQLFVAISLIIIAIGLRPGEARHVFKLVRIPAAIAAIPLAWMLIQLLPIAISGLSRSIWESAASALETPRLLASITIDPGLTLIAVSYFAAMAASRWSPLVFRSTGNVQRNCCYCWPPPQSSCRSSS